MEVTPDSALPQQDLQRAMSQVNQLQGRDDNESFNTLLDCLNSQFWSVRKRAAELIAARGDGVVQRIQNQFPTLSDNQRHWALTIMAWLLGSEALPWLKTAYAARAASVRSSVIAAVSEISSPAAVDFLMKALEDDSWLNRYAAAEALERRGEAVLDRLKDGFSDGRGDLKFWSLQLLVRIFGRSVANFMNNCRTHEDPDIRHYAIRALEESDEDWASEQLVECLADQHWTNRQLASRVLVGKSKHSVTPLCQALHHTNPDVVYWALQTLGKIGDDSMLKPIVLLVLTSQGDRAADIRRWAIEALGDLKTEASARRLLEIAIEFRDLRERIGALLSTFKGRAVRVLIKDIMSPNPDLRGFIRGTLTSMDLPGLPGLLKDLDARPKVDHDGFNRSLQHLPEAQLDEVFSRPELDITSVIAMVGSASGLDQSSISKIRVGFSRADINRALGKGPDEPAPPPKPPADPMAVTSDTSSVVRRRTHPVPETYPISLDDVLVKAINAGASDIHFKAGVPPIFRIQGLLRQTDLPALSAGQTVHVISQALNSGQMDKLEEHKEMDAGYEIAGISRFRINAFSEMNGLGMVTRVIPNRVPTLSDLELPRVFRNFCNALHGIILICGPTGMGKSTTLAAMIDYINETREEHVITVEDPIEFRHNNKRCLITSRELGANTHSFANALRSALREDPDIILVGELRDFETIQLAMTAAETGHLVLTTLHTGTSAEAVDRLINTFPPEQQGNARVLLASVLRAVCCQMLVPTTDGKRVAVMEVLINTFAVQNLIREKKMNQIDQAVVSGRREGMQSRDDHLFELHLTGRINTPTALEYAHNRQELESKLKRKA